jgi:hypothetical protein
MACACFFSLFTRYLFVSARIHRDMHAYVDAHIQVSGLSGLPQNVSKKIDQGKQTLRKLDNILYELSLSRKSAATSDDAPPEDAKGGDDNDA